MLLDERSLVPMARITSLVKNGRAQYTSGTVEIYRNLIQSSNFSQSGVLWGGFSSAYMTQQLISGYGRRLTFTAQPTENTPYFYTSGSGGDSSYGNLSVVTPGTHYWY